MKKQLKQIMKKSEVDKHTKHLAKEDLKLTKALYSGMERIALELLKTKQEVSELKDYIKINFSRNTNYIN